MKESVAVILSHQDKIYCIKRQNYLKVFPGYFSFPGGKVDESDCATFYPAISPHILGAMARELKEEVDLDLEFEFKNGNVEKIIDLGLAITPDFNPYRFKNYYFKINFKNMPNLQADENEAMWAGLDFPKNFLEKYKKGEMLAVPPMVKLLKTLTNNPQYEAAINYELPYDKDIEVPMIESVAGVKQFMPLSNTLPPAIRTNCFLINNQVLVDPSPKDLGELAKLNKSLENEKFNLIFLTHHHPDHYEYCVEIAQERNIPVYISKKSYKYFSPDYFKNVKVHLVNDNDIIGDYFGSALRVMDISGHADGQFGLYPENKSWYIVGDLIQGVGTVVIGGSGSSMGEYLSSLEKVIKLGPQVIFPSHGIATGSTNRLEETRQHRLKREDQVFKLLKENKPLIEMLKNIYPDLPENLKSFALQNIESHITHLREIGKII
jgi:glyoxylase-like metal-dependent hydrolase (beta-lactamase superfamily II)/8-oxo-dGTP pyrophosphatase MutT (NUDIX family)